MVIDINEMYMMIMTMMMMMMMKKMNKVSYLFRNTSNKLATIINQPTFNRSRILYFCTCFNLVFLGVPEFFRESLIIFIAWIPAVSPIPILGAYNIGS